MDVVASSIAEVVRENIALAAARGDDQPSPDQPRRALTASTAMLTREQASAMVDEVNEVLTRWSESGLRDLRDRPEAAGRMLYRIVFAVGPSDGPGPDRPEGT